MLDFSKKALVFVFKWKLHKAVTGGWVLWDSLSVLEFATGLLDDFKI